MGWDPDHPYWLECWFSGDQEDRSPIFVVLPEIPASQTIIELEDGELISVINVWYKKGQPTLHVTSLGKEK